MEENFSEKEVSRYKVKLGNKEELEAHEIFFESQKFKKDSSILETEEGRFEVPIKSRVFLALLAVFFLSFLGILGRIAYFQLARAEEFQKRAWQNQVNIYPAEAKRGIIYDRDYQALVSNFSSFDLIADPRELPHTKKDLENLIQKITPVLKIDKSEIEDKFERHLLQSTPFLLVSNIDHDTFLFFNANKIAGLSIEQSSIREYKDSGYFAHILGYLGKINDEELKNNPDYFITESVGRMGLEAQYQRILRGEFGQKIIERDAKGNIFGEEIEKMPKDGQNLLLFLDASLQKKLYDSLSATLKEIGASRAVAVAIDPRNGGILAMVSLPSFDNNLFAKGISAKDFQKLNSDPAAPLLNRAIAGQYPSGSTIKPLLAAAALQEKVITPEKTIFDSGSIQVGNYTFMDWKPHGIVNMIKAIAESANVYFYTIGGGYGDIDGLGPDRIIKYLKLFGWGERLEIDLPGEAPGFLPTPDWKKETKNEKWFIGDTYNISIGQGDLGVTPLQLAMATAAIANSGTLFKPAMVDKIIDADKNVVSELPPEIIRSNFIDQKNIDVVRKGMREVVVSGTARSLSVLPVAVAGKTGTAQFGNQGKTHAWFTSFAPYDKPEIALAIVVEGGGEGSSAAVPVARDVLNWYFRKK